MLAELQRLDCEDSLLAFVRYLWHVLEPATTLVLGDVLEAVCEHLEAVTRGDENRLLVNVPPGSMKSLLTDVFWPAWEWTTRPHLRYVAFAYAAELTTRDNRKFLALVSSPEYQRFWGEGGRGKARFSLVKQGEVLVSNTSGGFKRATSVGGVGTGERGDRVIIDDPHNVREGESEAIRLSTAEWFTNAVSNRLNDLRTGAIVVIMQRVHEEDVSGIILSKRLPYTHLMIPAEYEVGRDVQNRLGWQDWRSEEGESFWPDRYPVDVLADMRRVMDPFAYAGQYQQRPDPKGGGIIRREWWGSYPGKVGGKLKPYPTFDYVVAALDTAFGEKETNDFSAMTIWGVYTDDRGVPRALMMHAWQDRLAIHDLVEKTATTCRHVKPDRVLIEAKASGISLRQELHRLYAGEDWGVTMVDPKRQDKTARVHAIAHVFHEGLVQVPVVVDSDGTETPFAWAQTVIDQTALFPKASHDDLVDTVSMALRHFRDLGLLTRAVERQREDLEAMTQPISLPRLYPA